MNYFLNASFFINLKCVLLLVYCVLIAFFFFPIIMNSKLANFLKDVISTKVNQIMNGSWLVNFNCCSKTQKNRALRFIFNITSFDTFISNPLKWGLTCFKNNIPFPHNTFCFEVNLH